MSGEAGGKERTTLPGLNEVKFAYKTGFYVRVYSNSNDGK